MSATRWGARCLLLAGPLFLAANRAAAVPWHDPSYSWSVHTISDLGNVTCGRWDTGRPRTVCSPWHPVFNGGAVAVGMLLAVGVLLSWSALGRGPVVRAAQGATLLAAAGYVLVGVRPADVDENAHVLGALLILVPGNLGILVAALARPATLLGSARRLSLALGSAGVLGTLLFLARVDLGLGVGGMERVAVFPLLIWQVGLALLLPTGRAARDG